MKKCLRDVLLFGIFIFFFQQLNGQGITRSYGLGFRAGFWKRQDKTMSIHVSSDFMNSSGSGSVNVGGVGGSLYFFSRLAPRWFLEASIGASADVHVEQINFFSDEVDVAVLMPFLFGFRFDVLPTRIASNFQPYLSGGVGPYWMMKTLVEEDFIAETDVTIESEFNYGAYTGCGLHLVLSSWFGFNFDLKYHFVDLKPSHDYSGFEFSTGFVFMWGRKREIFRVRDINVIVKDIYPTYYQFYNTYPIALVSIQNTVGYPIEVNVHSDMKGYSERTHQSGFIEIPRGETKDLPVHVLLGPKLLESSYSESAVIDLVIEARAGVTLRKTLSAQVMVHSRNAWNGEMDKLGFFITPENDTILAFSREIVRNVPDSIAPECEKFMIARMLYNQLQQLDIQYQSDPNIPFYRDDRVQFAEKTLRDGTGDCDDLVVLYASLLESQGIETAFVDVQDPEKSIAHVYLLFDTGVTPEQGDIISTNEKRYVIRERERGGPTLWIPVETTMIQNGFDAAWNTGAMQYLQEGILRHGLAEGWIRIVDLD